MSGYVNEIPEMGSKGKRGRFRPRGLGPNCPAVYPMYALMRDATTRTISFIL